MINTSDFAKLEFSAAMTEKIDAILTNHLDKGPEQEDLTFALWRPSQGKKRFSCLVCEVILPTEGDRELHGNVAFTSKYVQRILNQVPSGVGIGLIHSHLGPGWQSMSHDDVVAERDRLASAVGGRTNLPLLGMTRGTDGTWSARLWLRKGVRKYEAHWTRNVRVVGRRLRLSFNPKIAPVDLSGPNQIATVSVWGEGNQADLARIHVGIIGLGSVGSIDAESLSRIGVSLFTLMDHDKIKDRNLDRTMGATKDDARIGRSKVDVSMRLIKKSHTARELHILPYRGSLLSEEGVGYALDCDVLFSCVDRPLPRHLLNSISYSHLIPVIDGGILAKIDKGRLVNADWRIHAVGPGKACLVCLGALRRGDVSLDLSGRLDDPIYIKGLDSRFNELLFRQNVFPFSMSVAAHEVLQFMGLISGIQRIGGNGPQMYHAYPGRMDVIDDRRCEEGCEYESLTATGAELTALERTD